MGLRLLALAVVAVLAFIANAYAQDIWSALLFPLVVPRPYSEMVSAAIVGALAAAAVSAFPLARILGSKAWIGGLIVALPVILLRAPEIGAHDSSYGPAISNMAWIEILSYSIAVVCSAWLLSRHSIGREDAPQSQR
ncbi:hypothetical protein [Nitrogeniibacter aestuarii]